jgi:hypothetical protein
MIRCGYRIVGQRWIALRPMRDGGGRIEMLHIPGQVERAHAPILSGHLDSVAPRWVDLCDEYGGCEQGRALCEAVALIHPSRRATAQALALPPERALDALRRAWPIVELHRTRGHPHVRLAQGCRCSELHLSRRPEDLLPLLDAMRSDSPASRPSAAHRARRFVSALVRG